MTTGLLKLWNLLHGSFWFLPTLMSLTVLGLGLRSGAGRHLARPAAGVPCHGMSNA